MRPVVAFDVNETLLDLSVLDQHFGSAFGDASLRPLWFLQMLQLSFVGIITDTYVDFTTAQRAALQMVAERRGVDIGRDECEAIVGGMRSLPAHLEVRDALLRLRDRRVPLCTLTNSPLAVVEVQLEFAGIRDCFDAVLSADEVGRLKPAREPYELVAERMSCEIGDVMLVAAHAWDVSGALAAGCRAAFVSRPGAVASPLGPRADIVASDISDVADRILERLDSDAAPSVRRSHRID